MILSWAPVEKPTFLARLKDSRRLGGYVVFEQGVLTVQGVITFPDRTFEYGNTFEFTLEGKMIDRWFQNAFGPWRPGHVIEFAEKKSNGTG